MHYYRWRKYGDPHKTAIRRVLGTLEDRLWGRVDVGHPLGCWLWTASTYNGYGGFQFQGTRYFAHRLSYELMKGPIPDGYFIDHLCRTPRCVNPDHLEAVTCGENSRRGAHPNYRVARYGRCKRGHPTNDAYVNPSTGGRSCATCLRDRKRRANRSMEGPK